MNRRHEDIAGSLTVIGSDDGTVTPAEDGTHDRRIGSLLVDIGRLTPGDVEVVLEEQTRNGGRFGDIARKLGLVERAELEESLARQFDYPYLRADDRSVSSRVITAFKPASPVGESMRALRSQLMIRWFSRVPHRPALTIAGVGRGEGRSFVAANLAVAFAQMGQRTVLIDADLRNPLQHALFRIRQKRGLAAILAGRASVDAVVDLEAVPGLSVLPAGALPPNPQELLARPSFDTLLAELAERFSVILIDTSAAADSADSQWVAQRTRGALMVARRDHTSIARLNDLDATLRQVDVEVIGSVFNDF
jgi:protein-tyrosine kinase